MQVLEFLTDQNEFEPSEKRPKVTLAVIDEFEGAKKYSFLLYNQDLQASAERFRMLEMSDRRRREMESENMSGKRTF